MNKNRSKRCMLWTEIKPCIIHLINILIYWWSVRFLSLFTGYPWAVFPQLYHNDLSLFLSRHSHNKRFVDWRPWWSRFRVFVVIIIVARVVVIVVVWCLFPKLCAHFVLRLFVTDLCNSPAIRHQIEFNWHTKRISRRNCKINRNCH